MGMLRSDPLRRTRLVVAASVALVVGGCVATDSRPPAPNHPILERAERHLLAGEDEEALRLYRSYRMGFQSSPFEAECRYWEGAILLKRGQVPEAEQSFRAAIAAPRSPFVEANSWIGLGDCRFVRDDYEGAIVAYQRALDAKVPDARRDYALYRLGVARQRKGDWDAGRACFDLLVRDHEKSPLTVRASQRLRYPDRNLHLQVGAFQTEARAKELETLLHSKGLPAKTVNVANGPAPYLVWVGDYPSFSHAKSAIPGVKSICGEDVVLVP